MHGVSVKPVWIGSLSYLETIPAYAVELHPVNKFPFPLLLVFWDGGALLPFAPKPGLICLKWRTDFLRNRLLPAMSSASWSIHYFSAAQPCNFHPTSIYFPIQQLRDWPETESVQSATPYVKGRAGTVCVPNTILPIALYMHILSQGGFIFSLFSCIPITLPS